jgi:S-adenosylmethionine hydrolase
LNPRARLVDLTHDVAAQDVMAGALLLRSAVRYFPPGTVHLAVVDPGVGSSRQALVIAARDAFLIGPDNGLLYPAAEKLGIKRIYAIDCSRLEAQDALPGPVSQTFHGRDLFAPAAALVSAGVTPGKIAAVTREVVELKIPRCRARKSEIEGEVIHIDGFGNLITNITSDDLARLGHATRLAGFPERSVSVSVGDTEIRGLVSAYAEVPHGELLAIVGSCSLLEVSVSGGNAARQLATARGAPVRVGL